MTVALAPFPRFQWITPAGQPAVGYQLFSYIAGTSTPQATYVDSTQTTQNTNPIILDSFGSASVWLNVLQTYKLVLQDANGNPVWSQDQIAGSGFLGAGSLIPSVTNTFNIGSPSFTWANGYFGTQIYVAGSPIVQLQTAAESAAGVTPVNLQYAPGDVRRYGADPTGILDSTTAITNALAAHAGAAVHAPAGTYKCTAQINIAANTMLYGDGMGVTTLTFNNGNANQIVPIGNKVTIKDLTLAVTVIGANSNVAGININGADWCQVIRVEVTGVSWAGVGIFTTSSHNLVEACYFHDFLGTVQDSADIMLSYLTGNTNYNIIRDNLCFGGNEVGIHILGTTGVNPQYNLIIGNRIGQHTTYGILDYRSANGIDCFNQFIGNYIENIQGTTRSGESGAGFYIQGAGGDLIQGNTIRNCCVQTTARGLAPAGIGVSGIGVAVQAPINIIGNVVEGMTKFDGILFVASPNGGSIVGNTIRMPVNTTGDAAININGASNVVCDGNSIDILPVSGSTVGGIFVQIPTSQINVVVSNNRITGGNSRGILVTVTGGSTLTGATFSGNQISGAGGGSDLFSFTNLIGATITGNYSNTPTNKALVIGACTQTRIANNTLLSAGGTAFSASGTCTGSYFDKTNLFNGLLTNAATGLICEQLSNAINGSSSAVGDRVEQSVPVVGQPKGWRCTVAGNPGTWVSEGNL